MLNIKEKDDYRMNFMFPKDGKSEIFNSVS